MHKDFLMELVGMTSPAKMETDAVIAPVKSAACNNQFTILLCAEMKSLRF